MVKQGKFEDILADSLEYTITTGSSALGRGTDYQTLTTFIGTITGLIPPEQLGSVLNMEELTRRLAYSLDVNTASLIKTEEQRQVEQQAQHQAQLEQQVAPEVAKAQLNNN